MNNRLIIISIVGFGNVGRAITHQLISTNDYQSIIINIIDPSDAIEGSYLDLIHASMFNCNCTIKQNDKGLFNKSNYIFHCAGASVPKNGDRLSVLKETANITNEVFQGFSPTTKTRIIVVANPVDIICCQIYQLTKSYKNVVVIGTGTLLDTIRMKYYLSINSKYNPKDISPLILGEHGRSMVLLTSNSFIHGNKICAVLSNQIIEKALTQTFETASEIEKTQGATYYAVAYCAIEIMNSLLSNSKRHIITSFLIPKEIQNLLNCSPVYMSIPTIIFKDTVTLNLNKFNPNNEDVQALKKSAMVLEENIRLLIQN